MVMQRVQQRRERENRQINERLKTLIAAYKVLGGSFTGTLTVDPTHLRELNRNQASTLPDPDTVPETSGHIYSSDRSRRIRDADVLRVLRGQTLVLGVSRVCQKNK